MKFIPCKKGLCTYEGTHCEGCGRSHAEIAETKSLIANIVTFAQEQDYENIEEFADFVGKSVLKKLQDPS